MDRRWLFVGLLVLVVGSLLFVRESLKYPVEFMRSEGFQFITEGRSSIYVYSYGLFAPVDRNKVYFASTYTIYPSSAGSQVFVIDGSEDDLNVEMVVKVTGCYAGKYGMDYGVFVPASDANYLIGWTYTQKYQIVNLSTGKCVQGSYGDAVAIAGYYDSQDGSLYVLVHGKGSSGSNSQYLSIYRCSVDEYIQHPNSFDGCELNYSVTWSSDSPLGGSVTSIGYPAYFGRVAGHFVLLTYAGDVFVVFRSEDEGGPLAWAFSRPNIDLARTYPLEVHGKYFFAVQGRVFVYDPVSYEFNLVADWPLPRRGIYYYIPPMYYARDDENGVDVLVVAYEYDSSKILIGEVCVGPEGNVEDCGYEIRSDVSFSAERQNASFAMRLGRAFAVFDAQWRGGGTVAYYSAPELPVSTGSGGEGSSGNDQNVPSTGGSEENAPSGSGSIGSGGVSHMGGTVSLQPSASTSGEVSAVQQASPVSTGVPSWVFVGLVVAMVAIYFVFVARR